MYFLMPHKFRWGHLLAASCLFYAAFIPVYLLILFLTIIIDYIAGIMIEHAQGKKRKLYLVISIVTNVGILAFFKYYYFFSDNFNQLFAVLDLQTFSLPFLNIILPLGLSFHTFQAMSYTVEVYRGNQKPEKHLGIYALYVMFYPQLVAGPIERPQNMLHQFYERHTFKYDLVVSGLKLMLWGFFKKVVIADRLALFTDPVFSSPQDYPASTIFLAAVFFNFQVFCDFSGYSDIALGTARIMGFKLMPNFNRPFHSRTISEFWMRWHISLSSWFRDYLYIPMGGNRVAVPRAYFNLFFVFLVSGFWHGANWTFIVWGALHGFYSIFALFTKDGRKRINEAIGLTRVKWLHNAIQVITTFLLCSFALIIFRAKHLSDAWYMIKKLLLIPGELKEFILTRNFSLFRIPISMRTLALCAALIILLEMVHQLQARINLNQWLASRPLYFRWAVYYAVVLIILTIGIFNSRNFIYFQF
jgi:alginate O-acetyltransferase complex protein AlgI